MNDMQSLSICINNHTNIDLCEIMVFGAIGVLMDWFLVLMCAKFLCGILICPIWLRLYIIL